jgi:two-component system, chemotaxis family, protein-glutamate methylesterase/glutaminase
VTIVKPETLTPSEAPDGAPSGFTCPRCGGSMWETPGQTLGFQCRIGHRLSLGGMLAEHGAIRRGKLIEAGRLMAEAAALNHRIASYAQERGHALAAQRLHQEAEVLEHRSAEIMQMASAVLAEPPEA